MKRTYVHRSSEQSLAERRLANARRTDDVAHENCARVALLAVAGAMRLRDGNGRQLIVCSRGVVSEIGEQFASPPHVQVRHQTPLGHITF